MNEPKKTIILLLIGAAVGVAAGYLLASDDKEELISDFKDTAGKVNDSLHNEVAKAKKFASDLRDGVNDFLKRV